jgi:hypothetical protein
MNKICSETITGAKKIGKSSCRFKIRGGVFWKIYFWWDYKVMMSKPILWLSYRWWKLTHKIKINDDGLVVILKRRNKK